MAKTARKQEVFEFPSGGIADFYMEDHEIELLEKEEAEQEFGSAGIATFNPIARRMASYGRYGDDTVAHVETGELVVPKALIDSNPKLKASIFSHLRELGVEDPEQYVVGSGLNSINPDTGMPEFFLKKLFKGVKKAVSGVVKGVKKAFKSVVKVVKKAAPVVIPFALNALFPGLGAIYSGALGAGIGTLVQGGSVKDAFKNALIGGAIGGATSAISGGLQAAKAGGSFGQGAVKGLSEASKLSNLQTAGKQLATGQFGQSGYESVTAGEQLAKATAGTDISSTSDAATAVSGPEVEIFDIPAAQGTDASVYDPEKFGVNMNRVVLDPKTEPGMFENLTGKFDTAVDFLTGGTPSDEAIYKLAGEKMAAAKQAGLELASSDAIAAATKELSPGLIRKFGPSLALAGAGAAAGGFFSKPEQESLNIDDIRPPIKTGPEYELPGETPTGASGDVKVATDYTSGYLQNPFINPFVRPMLGAQFAADGGEIFPRRTGGIMPNEGTPGEDSVRAMLMPGEFVMTTDAVKGMGDGNNEKGINRMYDMMRNLESRGKAMA